MKNRLILAALICSLPIGIAWYIAKSIQWERRRGFHGRYPQPVDPWIHGDGGRPPVMQDHTTNGGAAWKKT